MGYNIGSVGMLTRKQSAAALFAAIGRVGEGVSRGDSGYAAVLATDVFVEAAGLMYDVNFEEALTDALVNCGLPARGTHPLPNLLAAFLQAVARFAGENV